MPSIGDHLAGRYRLVARIGSGGFATVYHARDLRLERDVAVKVLLANHASDPVVAARFDREARVLAAVSHPNVVAIHDVSPGDPAAGTEPFLVMDLCTGGSLADRLATSPSRALPPDDLVPILVDVASGLGALHARGIVHRDLKPSNILLGEGRARIADLGIAAAGPSELTAPGTAIGTLAYLAPEQLMGDPASPASDVHALGIVAFLGLTGGLPRPADSVSGLVAASRRPVDRVSVRDPTLGAAFDAAVAGALAADPSRRPSAAELGAMLGASRARAREAAPLATSSTASDATTLRGLDLDLDRDTTSAMVDTRDPEGGRMLAVAVAVVLIGAVLVAATGLALLRPGGSAGVERPSIPGGALEVSPSAPASLVPTPSPAPTPTPTAKPTPTPTPTPTIDPYVPARAASDEMRAAIAASRGKDGLKGHEAKDLEDQLDRFDRALETLDARAARDAADRLDRLVGDLVDRRAVEGDIADRLQIAVERLMAIAQDLPD